MDGFCKRIFLQIFDILLKLVYNTQAAHPSVKKKNKPARELLTVETDEHKTPVHCLVVQQRCNMMKGGGSPSDHGGI